MYLYVHMYIYVCVFLCDGCGMMSVGLPGSLQHICGGNSLRPLAEGSEMKTPWGATGKLCGAVGSELRLRINHTEIELGTAKRALLSAKWEGDQGRESKLRLLMKAETDQIRPVSGRNASMVLEAAVGPIRVLKENHLPSFSPGHPQSRDAEKTNIFQSGGARYRIH